MTKLSFYFYKYDKLKMIKTLKMRENKKFCSFDNERMKTVEVCTWPCALEDIWYFTFLFSVLYFIFSYFLILFSVCTWPCTLEDIWYFTSLCTPLINSIHYIEGKLIKPIIFQYWANTQDKILLPPFKFWPKFKMPKLSILFLKAFLKLKD